MIFKQLFDSKSSTYTYLIASAKGREAIIIDPVLENVDEYIAHLKELDLNWRMACRALDGSLDFIFFSSSSFSLFVRFSLDGER